MAQAKRQVAHHIRISTLLNGEYVKQEGWEPNYVMTSNGQQVSRVNIIGVIISPPTPVEVEIDDGSGRLILRQFDESVRLMHLKVGDPVIVIGRPREYERQIYVLPEIVKKLQNPEWLKVRQTQLQAETLQAPREEPLKDDHIEPKKQESQSFREQYETIYSLIKQMDDGRGADIEEVLQSANLQNGEEIIKQLILEGEVFEMSPGMLKVLE